MEKLNLALEQAKFKTAIKLAIDAYEKATQQDIDGFTYSTTRVNTTNIGGNTTYLKIDSNISIQLFQF